MGNALWAKKAGNNNAYVYDITTDKDGYVYIVGKFNNDSINFGNTPTLIGNGYGEGIFIVKYDSLGNVIWAKTGYGTPCSTGNGGAIVKSIAIDLSNNLYITGHYSNTFQFGNTTALTITNGGSQVFIVKYDSSGNAIWAKSSSGGINRSSSGNGNSIIADAKGNTYITGFFNDTIQFGNTTPLIDLNDSISIRAIFIVKYDSSGNALWARSAGGGNLHDNDSRSIALDGNGDVYITGEYNDTIQFGNTTPLISNLGNYYNSVFIAKYDASGNALWSRSSAIGAVNCQEITVDIYNNIYITGCFYADSIKFGNTPTMINCFTLFGESDLFIVKYDASGNALWSQSVGSSEWEFGRAIKADAFGNIYVTGFSTSSAIQFPGTPALNINWGNVFLVKYSNHLLTEIEENKIEGNVVVYPNPSQGSFMVALPEQASYIEISNSLGQQIEKRNVNNENILNFDIKQNGMYFIKIVTEKEIITKKMIIEK